MVATSKEDLPKTDDGTKIDTKFEENTLLYGGVKITAENAASLKTGELTLFYNGVGSAVFE